VNPQEDPKVSCPTTPVTDVVLNGAGTPTKKGKSTFYSSILVNGYNIGSVKQAPNFTGKDFIFYQTFSAVKFPK